MSGRRFRYSGEGGFRTGVDPVVPEGFYIWNRGSVSFVPIYHPGSVRAEPGRPGNSLELGLSLERQEHFDFAADVIEVIQIHIDCLVHFEDSFSEEQLIIFPFELRYYGLARIEASE